MKKFDYGIDPYDMKKFDYGIDSLTNVVNPDDVNDLLFALSPYTAEQLKCLKSMDSYKYFVSGFDKEVAAKI